MERSLRAARVATFVYFVLDGTLMGMWLVQIPAVEKRAGISHATLGSLLVLLGLGAFIGMRVVAGWPTDSARASWSPPPVCCAVRLWYCRGLPGGRGRWLARCWCSASATAAWT